MTAPTEAETIGPFTIHPPGDNAGTYALSWAGAWLPGTYATRDAVLLAIGIVTGGEGRFYLDDLRGHEPITTDMIMTMLEERTPRD